MSEFLNTTITTEALTVFKLSQHGDRIRCKSFLHHTDFNLTLNKSRSSNIPTRMVQNGAREFEAKNVATATVQLAVLEKHPIELYLVDQN